MKLSTPIYRLKRKAKKIASEQRIPLSAALNLIARKEGFRCWSLLAAQQSAESPVKEVLSLLNPGDLLLLGARPGHGKTLFSLELVVAGIKSGRRGWFFTLELNISDILKRLSIIGTDMAALKDKFDFDNSDAINAEYIIERLEKSPRGTIVVVDYLQLLDRKRDNLDLETQIRLLKSFADKRGLIITFVSQIDRSYDSSEKSCPGFEHVRLPNPLSLNLFNKTCFLNNREIEISSVC